MPEVTIDVQKLVDLPKKHAGVVAALVRGVRIQTEAGVEWIKEEVFEGQRYVGDSLYPDVSERTKAIKAQKGKEKVGIDTSNLKNSFNSSYDVGGLVGKINGGGPGYGKFLARWQIDALFYRERHRAVAEGIESEVKRSL